jgi:hypothetical protein
LDLQIDEKCNELKMPGDTSDYAVATPVTSAQGGEGLGAGGPEVGGGVVGSAAGWLMRVFGPVIETLVLAMLDPGHDLPLGRGVALQLVGDEHTRGSTVLLEELSEQALGGLLVAPALNQDIENEAMLVDGTSEPMLFPGDADDDLIQAPFVATANSRPNLRPHCRIVSWVTGAGKLSLQPEALGAGQEATNGLKHFEKRPRRGSADRGPPDLIRFPTDPPGSSARPTMPD